MPAPRFDRQPWPMKWIVVAIVIGLGLYTYLTLHYRKAAPAFRPYEDIRSRANVIRLLSAGYQRIPLAAQRPADPETFDGAAPINDAPSGVPADLRSTLVDQPLLPAEIIRVAAAPAANVLLPY